MNNYFKFNFNFNIKIGPSFLSIDIKSNASTIALQAPSGSGKTSFLRTIAGLNKNFTGTTGHITKRIGYVPQDSLLIPTLTVKDNLLLSTFSDRNQLPAICQALSIQDLLKRKPNLLSGGEKQRVSIGRALLARPELLLLDEPFAALDDVVRNNIIGYIKDLIKENKMDLILVTHDESASKILCEEFWTIKDNSLSIYRR